jgi:ParB family chromosome partitioning protein
MEGRPNRLGRGLAALIGDDDPVRASQAPPAQTPAADRFLPVAFLTPGRYQPRKYFSEEALDELAASIRARGVLQPILVRPLPGGRDSYEIVAGERRWRAAQRAGLHDVPVIVRALDDGETLEIALIENIQRSDLNALEEAQGYQRLMEQFAYTQETLSKIIGKSRSHVANTLRLLTLPGSVQSRIAEGALSAGHARALVTAKNPEELARQIVEKGLSVRETEQLAREAVQKKNTARAASSKSDGFKDADTRALENNLSNTLGLKVSVSYGGEKKGGEVKIRYRSLEQLDDICRRLGQGTSSSF